MFYSVLVSEDCNNIQLTFKYFATKRCTEPAEVAQRHQVAQNISRFIRIYFPHLVILSVFVSLWQNLSSFYPDNSDK